MRLTLFLIVLSFSFVSCERQVDFKLNDVSPKLVVEGIIENDRYPIVYLSESIGYFSSLDLAVISNSFVHNADVYISDGTLTHKLKEYKFPVVNGIDFYYYAIDSSSLATAFRGEVNHQYSLRIVWNAEEYTATTRIPNITQRIDSLSWKPAPAGVTDDKVILMATITDPPGFGDYNRYYTQRNREQFYPGVTSVNDDQVSDGTTYTVQVNRGLPRDEYSDSKRFFYHGDSVTLKLSNIDKATFDFWRTMEFTYSSVGNPFSSPTRVINNISNGALGYFGGYASQYKTIVIPR
jgi:hypothetical protein